MPEQFSIFETVLNKRNQTWKWSVWTAQGDIVMHGSERTRAAAKYSAERALFLLLLSAPYRSMQRKS